MGKRLQLARRRAGLTQQELCHKAGLSYSTLAKIERGAIKSPSVFTVASIAGATNTPFEDLLEIKSDGQSPTRSEPKKRSKTGVRFVYFDGNGVLVRFYHRAFTQIARETHASADLIETLFWRHNDAACSGQLSIDKFNAIFEKELDIKGFDWRKYYLKNVEAMPGVKELVEWAAKNYEIGILSNNMPGLIDSLCEDKIFPDVTYTTIVDSSKVGIIKPDPKIYEMAEQLSGVKASEILLVDDSRPNLVAADKAGWHVMWFDDLRPAESIIKVKQSLAF